MCKEKPPNQYAFSQLNKKWRHWGGKMTEEMVESFNGLGMENSRERKQAN